MRRLTDPKLLAVVPAAWVFVVMLAHDDLHWTAGQWVLGAGVFVGCLALMALWVVTGKRT